MVGIAALALMIAGCASTPVVVPDDLSPAELFQRAQEAAEQGQWEAARLHYNAFLERFPDERDAGAEAEYELAFLLYKEGRYEEARDAFNALIARYDTERGLPDWPLVLSGRILEIMDEEGLGAAGEGSSPSTE